MWAAPPPVPTNIYLNPSATNPYTSPPRQQTLHQQYPHRPQQVSPLHHMQAEDVDVVEGVEGEDVEGHDSTKTNQHMDVRHQQQEEMQQGV